MCFLFRSVARLFLLFACDDRLPLFVSVESGSFDSSVCVPTFMCMCVCMGVRACVRACGAATAVMDKVVPGDCLGGDDVSAVLNGGDHTPQAGGGGRKRSKGGAGVQV